jgi:hypothetical protein
MDLWLYEFQLMILKGDVKQIGTTKDGRPIYVKTT